MCSMTIKAIKAKHGDAMILTADGATVLIDGGPSGVYNDFLKEHIEALGTGGEPPEIDLMMVSHIDSDHIQGILDLTSDMIDANEEEMRPPAVITRAWLNSFSDTLVKLEVENKRDSTARVTSLASAWDEDDELEAHIDGHTKLVLSSVRQGRNLRRDLKMLSTPVNLRFNNGMAIAGTDEGPWQQGELSITVIGPTMKEVEKLKKRWAKDLAKIKKKEADRRAATVGLDTSVFNLSSIVCIAEAGGKTMLLTGDARGDTILRWLEERGGPFEYDLLKLPHHGSDRNMTSEVFKKIKAKHYLVSGDGRHGNPEPEMFRMLFQARGNADYKIHMTYSPEEIKRHKEYKKHNLDVALDEVLAEFPQSKEILQWPKEGETSISVTL